MYSMYQVLLALATSLFDIEYSAPHYSESHITPALHVTA